MDKTPVKLRKVTKKLFTLFDLLENYSQAKEELDLLRQSGADPKLILNYRKLLLDILSKKVSIEDVVKNAIEERVDLALKETAVFIRKSGFLNDPQVREILVETLKYLEKRLKDSR